MKNSSYKFKSYYSLRLRLFSALTLLLTIPTLLGFDQLMFSHLAVIQAVEAQEEQSYQQFKANFFEYFRSDLLPSVRDLATEVQNGTAIDDLTDSFVSVEDGIAKSKLVLLDFIAETEEKETTENSDQIAYSLQTLRSSLTSLRQLENDVLKLKSEETTEVEAAIASIFTETDSLFIELPEIITVHDSLNLGETVPDTDTSLVLDLPQEIILSAVSTFDQDKISGVPVADDLSFDGAFNVNNETVSSLAEELKTPVKVFEYFRNNFVYEPYFGLNKGTKRTLEEKAGNDADIAAAMISVLRALGVPSRYAYGTIQLSPSEAANWLGVEDEEVAIAFAENHIPYKRSESGIYIIDRIWVLAYVDYLPYRGALEVKEPVNGDLSTVGDTWIELDPAFKKHTYSDRRNIENDLSINTNNLITNVKAQSTLAPLNAANAANSTAELSVDNVTKLPDVFIINNVIDLGNKLAEYMSQNQLWLDTIFRERQIVDETQGLLPSTDFYKIHARGPHFNLFPSQLATKVKLELSDISGQDDIIFETSLASAINSKIELNWVPSNAEDRTLIEEMDDNPAAFIDAYQADLIAQVLVDGQVVATSSKAVPTGSVKSAKWTITEAGGDKTSFPEASSNLVFTSTDFVKVGSPSTYHLAAGTVTADQLSEMASTLKTTPSLSNLLKSVALNFNAQADRFAALNSASLNTYVRRAPSILRTSYELQVNELFGQAFTSKAIGLVIKPVREAWAVMRTASDAPENATQLFTKSQQLTASVLGANGLNQMTGNKAVSAAKLLQIASKTEIPILTLTPQTDDQGKTTLALTDSVFDNLGLTISSITKSSILSALNDGFTVTFTRDPVFFANLSKEPVIISNPYSGDTAYLLLDPTQSASETAGSLVALKDEKALSLKNLILNGISITAPGFAQTDASGWLANLDDATISLALAYLPAIIHTNNMCEPNPEDVSRNVCHSSLDIATAAIALIGRIDEISARPAIVDVFMPETYISPNLDGIQDKFILQASTLRAANWNMRVTNSSGDQVNVFTQDDNKAPDNGNSNLLNLEWNMQDAEGFLLPDGRYSYKVTAYSEGSEAATFSENFTVDNRLPEADLTIDQFKDQGFDVIAFKGTANDLNFDNWKIELFDESQELVSIPFQSVAPVISNTFGLFDTTTVPNGSYTAKLTVRDKAGNVKTSSITEAFTIGNPVPDTTSPKLSAKSPVYGNNDALGGLIPVEVTAFDAGGLELVEIKLDGQVVASSALSPLKYSIDASQISEGPHTLSVRAVDKAGNESKLPSASFVTSKVSPDLIAPTVSFVLDKGINESGGKIFGVVHGKVTATDNIAVSKIEILIDGKVYALENSPQEGKFETCINVSELREGLHTIVARATDNSGNIGYSSGQTFISTRFIDDKDLPKVSVRTQDTSKAFSSSAPLLIKATDNLGIKKVEIEIDGSLVDTIENPIQEEIFEIIDTSLIADGPHTLQIKVEDTAGNTASTQLIDFTSASSGEDLSSPISSIKFPQKDTAYTGSVIASATAVDNVAVTKIEILVDDQVVGTANEGFLTMAIDMSQLLAGVHNLQTRATDAAGNESLSEPVSFFSLQSGNDTLAPQVTLTLPSTADKLTQPFTAQVLATDNVELASIDLFVDCDKVASAADPTTGILDFEIDPQNIFDGTHNVRAEVVDTNGNKTVSTIRLVSTLSDTEKPQVTLTIPEASAAYTGNLTLSTSATDNTGIKNLSLYLGDQLISTINQPQPSQLTATIDLSNFPEGAVDIKALAEDYSGNTQEQIQNISISHSAADTTKPIVSLLVPPTDQDWTGSVNLFASAIDNVDIATLKLLVDGSVLKGLVSPEPAELDYILDTSALTLGAHTLELTATDSAGNLASSGIINFNVATEGDNIEPGFIANFAGLKADTRSGNHLWIVPGTLNTDQTLTVNAFDNKGVGTIKVFLNQLPLAVSSDSNLTKEIKATDLADGTHTLTFAVSDISGNINNSVCIIFSIKTDLEAPVVTLEHDIADLASPVKGNINLQVSASDNRAVSRLEVLLDGKVIFSESGVSGLVTTVRAESLLDGEHKIIARAIDTIGNIGESETLTFTTFNPVSGFEVTPKKLEPGTLPTVTVKGQLQQNKSWTLTFDGPDAIAPVNGFSKFINSSIDVSGLKDGIYSVTLEVEGVSEKFTEEFTINFITGPPVAAITNLSNGQVVRDGLLELIGTANDPDEEDPVSYKFALYDLDGNEVGNVSPHPRNDQGFYENRVTAGSLGKADLTMVRNGVYNLQLIVKGGSNTIATPYYRICVESQLKVGQFGFSQQDLVLPVAGLPLTVVRTYNSLNKSKGDFGHSWTWAISDVELELNESRYTAETIDGEQISVRGGGDRSVTLTLPDGQRTTFSYDLVQADRFGLQYKAVWKAAPGVYATLQPTSSPIMNTLPGGLQYWQAAGLETPLEAFDFSGFKLTMKDGTQYLVERESLGEGYILEPDGSSIYVQAYGEGTLKKITDKAGNQVVFTGDKIEHFNAEGAPTKAIVFQRNAKGLVSAIYDPENMDENNNPNGPAAYTYEYDDEDRLIAANQLYNKEDLANPLYRKTQYKYENLAFPNYITEIVDPRGVSPMKTEYDETGRIIATIDAEGNRIRMEHNLAANTETIYDRLGNPTIHVYDDRGNVTRTVDAQGNITERTYDANNNELTVTDPLGNTTTMTYDGSGNMTSVTDPLGNKTTYSFDGSGNILSTVDPNGNITKATFNNQNNPTTHTNALGQVTSYSWDASGGFQGLTDAKGNTPISIKNNSSGLPETVTTNTGVVTQTPHDPKGRRTGTSTSWVNPEDPTDVRPVTTSISWEVSDQVDGITDFKGNSGNSEFDAAGNATAHNDKFGNTLNIVYDSRGDGVEVRHSNGTFSRSVYDAEGRIVLAQDSHEDGELPEGERTVYNSIGQVVRVERLKDVIIDIAIDANGTGTTSIVSVGDVISSRKTIFDKAGRPIEEIDEEGNISKVEYDEAGRTTAEIDALGNRTEFEYDKNGNRTLVRDALGKETTFEYDAENRLVKTVFADGTSMRKSYDEVGNVVSETDQTGKVTEFEYNENNQLTKVILPEVIDPESGDLVKPQYFYTYDIYGNLDTITDPKAGLTDYDYNQYRRLTSKSLPGGIESSYTYNQLDYMEAMKDAKGQITAFEYDSFGNVTKKKYYNSQADYEADNIAYSYSLYYDEKLRIDTVESPRGVTNYSYDFEGNPLTVQSPEGTINYEYDELTDLKIRTYSATSEIYYEYDDLDRLEKVIVVKKNDELLSEALEIIYTYNAVGRKVSVTYPNGIITTFAYDDLHRTTGVFHKNSSDEIVASFEYTLKDDGRIQSVVENKKQTDGSSVTRNISYQYDNLNRVVNETSSSDKAEENYSVTYEYDLTGNRVSKTSDNETITYLYNGAGQLVSESSTVTGNISYAYDANGALETKNGNGETVTYSYNHEDRLVSADIQRTENGKAVDIDVAYTYDYSGFKVRSNSTVDIDGSSQSENRYFLPDMANFTGYTQIFEESVDGSVLKSYVIGDDILAQMDANIQYLMYDQHGSTRVLTDSTGTVEENYDFDAYGKALAGKDKETDKAQSRHLYSGEQYDSMLKTQYLRARQYDQSNGTFNRIDPFDGSTELPQSFNKYGYTHGDPVNGIDPSGKFFSIADTLISNFIQNSLSQMKNINTLRAKKKAIDNQLKVLYSFVLSINYAVMNFEEPILRFRLVLFTSKIIKYQKKINKKVQRMPTLLPSFYDKMVRIIDTYANGPSTKTGVWIPRKMNGFYSFEMALHPVTGSQGSDVVTIGKSILFRNVTFLELKTSRSKDFRHANRKTGHKGPRGGTTKTNPNGTTWHHHEVPGVMMLLNSKMHGKTSHDGGRMILKMAYPNYR